MPRLKQKKAIKAVIKRLITEAVPKAIYIYFRIINKINIIIIIAVTLDLYF